MPALEQAIRWLQDVFPGSIVEWYDFPTIRQSKGPEMVAKKEPFFPFDEAGEAPASKNLGDYDDRLVLILPQEEGMLSTTFGTAEVTWADVVVQGGPGGLTWLPNTPIFWKGVRQQIGAKVGKGRWVAGRLKQLSRKDKAWALNELSAADRNTLAAMMNSPEFKATLEAPRPERQIPDEPF